MTTVRHIEKLYKAGSYGKLVRELLAGRIEASLRLEQELCALAHPAPVAALALIRLDELGQAHTPLAGRLLRTILGMQEIDGGWLDPLHTALCVSALMTCHGYGDAIDRGLGYLAALQRGDGAWPKIPIRRTPGDAFVTSFVLLRLGGDERFHRVVRFHEAITWLEAEEPSMDPEVRRLWDHVRRRAGMKRRLGLRVEALS